MYFVVNLTVKFPIIYSKEVKTYVCQENLQATFLHYKILLLIIRHKKSYSNYNLKILSLINTSITQY